MPWRMARHLAELDRNLCDLAAGRVKRLVVEMPPRHGKSELCSKYFPAWYLGSFPERNIILTSATDDLAMDFSASARDLLKEHGHLWGVRLRDDRSSVQRWQTSSGGGLRAAGVGGGIMGRGADMLIIDDYFKNVEVALSKRRREKLYEWYLSTSGTRLMPGGAVLIIATRWHKDDLIGCVLREAEQTGEEWRVVSFPAISGDGAALWPEQWPLPTMRAKEATYVASGYPWMWRALYQQQPPELLDVKWEAGYFEDVGFDKWPADDETLWKVLALDPSLGKSRDADYSAFVKAAACTDGFVYVDADLDRRDVRKIAVAGLEHCREWSPDCWAMETNGFAALEDLVQEMNSGALPVNTAKITQHANKRDRIELGLTTLLANKRLRFKNGSGGAALLVEQLRGFPAHEHDDGPDALEMAIRVIRKLSTEGMQGEPLPEAIAT